MCGSTLTEAYSVRVDKTLYACHHCDTGHLDATRKERLALLCIPSAFISEVSFTPRSSLNHKRTRLHVTPFTESPHTITTAPRLSSTKRLATMCTCT